MAAYCYRLYLVSHIKSNVRSWDLKDNDDFEDAYKVAAKVLPHFKGKSDSTVFKDIRNNFKKHKENMKSKK